LPAIPTDRTHQLRGCVALPRGMPLIGTCLDDADNHYYVAQKK